MAASADTINELAIGRTASFPVAAATTLYKGEMVTKKAGYLASLTDGDKFDGHLVAKVTNTTAAGYGTAGDLNGEVLRGKYKMEVTLSGHTENMVGIPIYAIDDNTYTIAPMRTIVGRLDQYVSATKGIVEFDTNISRLNMQSAGIVGIFEPFFQVPVCGTNTAGVPWVKTSVNGPGTITGILTRHSAYCGGIIITTDTAENDGESFQLNGEGFLMDVTTKPVIMGARIALNDATHSDVFLGLSITDTALLGGVTDCIAWRKVDESTDTKAVVEKDSTETESAASEHTMVDATAVNLGLVYNGTNVVPYVNGVAGTALAVTNLPNDEALTPSFEILAGAAAAKTLTINFLDAYQVL